MTLVITKNGKRDDRLRQYYQDVEELRVQKQALVQDLDKTKQELALLEEKRNSVKREIKNLVEDLELANLNKKDTIEELNGKIKDRTTKVTKLKNEITYLEKSVDGLLLSKEDLEKEISDYEVQTDDLKSEANKKSKETELLIQAEDKKLRKAAKRVEEVKLHIYKLKEEFKNVLEKKRDAEQEVMAKKIELKDLQELVDNLTAANKQGINVVKSLNAERDRLKEKALFLERKEKDLEVYERRINKNWKKLYPKAKMKFK